MFVEIGSSKLALKWLFTNDRIRVELACSHHPISGGLGL